MLQRFFKISSLSLCSQRDQALENKVLQWILGIVDDQPEADYEHFIQDGSVLSK